MPEDPERPDTEPDAPPEQAPEKEAPKERAKERPKFDTIPPDLYDEDEDPETTRSRLARLTRRLVERGGDETRHLLGTVLDGSDRAKTEMVRMMAREVRNYLEALKLKEDLMELATSHSLEIQASFSLKPLKPKEGPEPEPPEDTDTDE